jgi:hypothetical protein
MISWEELAIEYRKEIELLLDYIKYAYREFEKKAPNSYAKGLNILEESLDLAIENVRILSCSEPMDAVEKKDIPKNKIENKVEDDDWLFN